jgi:asparagine N-glycosylation enzyme membrane subunit Stt3
LTLGCGIVAYLAVAAIVARWLPGYVFLSWILLIFAAHTTLVLFFRKEKQRP